MKNKILLSLIFSFLLIFNPFNLAIPQSIDKNIKCDIQLKDESNCIYKNSSLIENFPYVSQETNFYCTYACPTMVIKYYGIETSLYEVLFNSGVGYSLIYSHPNLKRFFLSCIATSNWKSDRNFLAEIYGLEYIENRFYNKTKNENENWENYWSDIKKNILNQTPVITISDPIFLSSIRNCIKTELNISDDLVGKIPDLLWNFFPCFMNHMIVIIGFNENNNTICYNDPSAEVFGYPDFGKYSWMNITDFRYAMRLLSQNQPYYSYFTGVFHNTSHNSLKIMDRFILAYNRNIQRMRGNISHYDNYITEIWKCNNLGINGLNKFIKDNNNFGKINTINSYRLISTFYLFSISYKFYYLFDMFFPDLLNLDDYNSQMNYCYQLSIEKKDISNFLIDLQLTYNDSNISEICNYNSNILKLESENYSKLATNFSEFLGKGLFIKNSDAFVILDNMEKIVHNLIYLENKLLV